MYAGKTEVGNTLYTCTCIEIMFCNIIAHYFLNVFILFLPPSLPRLPPVRPQRGVSSDFAQVYPGD